MQIVPLVGAVLAVVVILGGIWRHFRVRALRRWKAAIETFVRLQLDHETGRQVLRRQGLHKS
jgi:hypothetical protein